MDVFSPISDDGKVDLIINNKRIQVKVVRKGSDYVYGSISIKKAGKRSSGEIKTYKYTKEDVDFIVGVDTDTLDIYIVPIAYAERYANNVSISKIVLEGYKNNINILA